MWVNDTATPLERPKVFADRAFVTEAEAKAWEGTYLTQGLRASAANQQFDPDFFVEATGIEIDTFEPGRLLPGRRTSQIVDPPDGRLPALTPEGQRRLAADRERYVHRMGDNPDNYPYSTRCVVVANTARPPLQPIFYNNSIQIVQTPGQVALVSEMVHDARIVDLRSRHHPPSTMRFWLGHSVGRWDGDTLVLETTNFNDKQTFRGSGPNMVLIERFSFADRNTITYEFTVNDPESFTRPFTARSEFRRTNSKMYEYACHENNYSLENMLRGARAQDKDGREFRSR